MTRGERRPVVLAPRFDREDEEAYFRTLQSRMPERSQRVIETLRRVRAVYVECGRDAALRANFDRFLERFYAGRNEVREEADIYILVGQSGAGKTKAVGRLLREHPGLQPVDTPYGTVTPYVSIKLKGYGLPRLVAARIIREAGYGQVNGSLQGEMFDGLNDALRAQRVFVVHVDEAQHLLRKNAGVKEQQELANAIKGASVDPNWPIVFVFSGLPEIINLARKDEQVDKRGDYTVFTDVAMPDESDLVEKIVCEMAGAAGLDVSGLVEGDFLERLAHAAHFRYGRICQLVLSAIHEALHRKTASLAIGHFAKAYERRTLAFGRPDKNPFITDAWRSLDHGSFLELPEDGQRDADAHD
ncbi:ATP-binding protein [Methylobacterium sp. C33D]